MVKDKNEHGGISLTVVELLAYQVQVEEVKLFASKDG